MLFFPCLLLLQFIVAFSTSECELHFSLLSKSNTLLPEASDITKVGQYYYVVGDDTCKVTKIDMNGNTSQINDGNCILDDFEALFRFPGDLDDNNPALIVCREDAEECNRWRNGEFLDSWNLVDGGEGCHANVHWGQNKGIEGAVGVVNSGDDVLMIVLIESNELNKPLITYKLSENDSQWISQGCSSLPPSMSAFRDHSGLAIYPSGSETIVAMTSQKSRKLWLGSTTEIQNGVLSSEFLTLTGGQVLDFPQEFEGVEGIFLESYDSETGSLSGVIASDDQAGLGSQQANAVHRFSLTCSSASVTTTSPAANGGATRHEYYPSEIDCPENELILQESDCETAAAVLGLDDVSVEVETNDEEPYGCYFLDGTLWLNTDDEAEPEEDAQRICQRTIIVPTTTTTAVTTSMLPTQFPSQSPTTTVSPIISFEPTKSPSHAPIATPAPSNSPIATPSPSNSPVVSPSASSVTSFPTSRTDDGDNDDLTKNSSSRPQIICLLLLWTLIMML